MEKVKEIAENMREPKMRDIRALSNIKNNEERELKLISNLSGLSEAELDDLTFKEYKVLQEKLADFLS